MFQKAIYCYFLLFFINLKIKINAVKQDLLYLQLRLILYFKYYFILLIKSSMMFCPTYFYLNNLKQLLLHLLILNILVKYSDIFIALPYPIFLIIINNFYSNFSLF